MGDVDDKSDRETPIWRDECDVSWRVGRDRMSADNWERVDRANDGAAEPATTATTATRSLNQCADGIVYSARLGNPGDDDREQLELLTDACVIFEDDDLELDDVVPIAVPGAWQDEGRRVGDFLAKAFGGNLDETDLQRIATETAKRYANETAVSRAGFEMEQISEYGTPRHHAGGDDGLHDACRNGHHTRIGEPGTATRGWLRRLDKSERTRWRIDDEHEAALAWVAPESPTRSGVQLLTRKEAELVEQRSTAGIVDRIVNDYRRAGGSDDGHAARALYRCAADRSFRNEAGGTWKPEAV